MEQSTILLKNVVPVEGTASCVFVKRKRNGLTAFADNRPLHVIAPESLPNKIKKQE